MTTQTQDALATRVRAQLEANALLREHGLADAGWTFVWDNARRRGGQCRYSTRQISMSKYLVPMWTMEQVRDVLIHEIAHALVGSGHGHGPVWARKMRELGAKPERTHSNETVQGRYAAICDACGAEVYRAHRYTAAMRQGRHLHSVCMKPVRWVDTRG